MSTILVVDDEPRIVQLARDYLAHAGFDVITATDGPSALASADGFLHREAPLTSPRLPDPFRFREVRCRSVPDRHH